VEKRRKSTSAFRSHTRRFYTPREAESEGDKAKLFSNFFWGGGAKETDVATT